MLTIELDIPYNKEFRAYQEHYSWMLRKVYSNMDMSADPKFKKEMLLKYNLLDESGYATVVNECVRRHELRNTKRNLVIDEYKLYTEELSNLTSVGKWYKIEKAKLQRKIASLTKFINSSADITFGGKENLRKVTRYANKKDIVAKDKALAKFRSGRLVPYSMIGNAFNHGNKKFLLLKDKITFKPKMGIKFNISYKTPRNKKTRATLAKLVEMTSLCHIALTIRLTTNKIFIIYDEEKVAGFNFDKNAFKQELKEKFIPKSDKALRTAMWLEYKREQEDRMLVGKNSNIFASIDLNPDRIGFSIVNLDKVLFHATYEMSQVLAMVDENDTSKIKYNLGKIYKRIFDHCIHYGVSSFVTEELTFEYDGWNTKACNRKTKGLWCRIFQFGLVSKYCHMIGINHITVKTNYSSFVGNMMYSQYDPVAASLEIARRGLVMKKKLTQKWYPSVKSLLSGSFQTHAHYQELLKCRNASDLYRMMRSLKIGYRRLEPPIFTSMLVDVLVDSSNKTYKYT